MGLRGIVLANRLSFIMFSRIKTQISRLDCLGVKDFLHMPSELFEATLTSQYLSLPKEKKIDDDHENEVIQLPVNENMDFFQGSLVNSVSCQVDTNRSCNIDISFDILNDVSDMQVKQMSYHSKDPTRATEIVQMFKTLGSKIAVRESERAEEKELLLSEHKVNPIRLTDVLIEPSFCGYGKKLSGILEAHINGFRYSTSKPGECVDISYVNIKHAIFQPADKESITLLDFHLHNHIMVGNKKRKSVQFYVKIEEQQKESLMKIKINVDFQNFVNLVNDHWEKLDIEFDTINIEHNDGKLDMKFSRAIVKTTIGDDPQHFIDEAGSEFLNMKARL